MGYFGGKGQDGVYQTIINEIPPHLAYFELFGGNAAIGRKINDVALKTIVEIDDQQANRLRGDGFNVSSECAIAFLAKLANQPIYTPNQRFVFLDPPYLLSTRKSDTRYRFELTQQQHIELLTCLAHIQGNAAITHYPCKLYDKALMHWRWVDFESVDRGGNIRQERLYLNYEKPDVLHDDRYLGRDKCQRQQIKRRIANYRTKFEGWTPQERAKALRELVPVLSEEEKQLLVSSLQGSSI